MSYTGIDINDRFVMVHNALCASLADDNITLPNKVTQAAVARILARIDATTEDPK